MTLTGREVRALLADNGLRPRQARGQNFVIDPNTVRRVARLAEVGPGDRVVEVGPGLGSLTLALAATGAEVTAVEVDAALVGVLRQVLSTRCAEGVDRVRVVEGDALVVDLEGLAGPGPWVLVSNLPYNIATPLVAGLLDRAPNLARLVFMVQREVAQRMVAGPGDPAYGAISVKVRYWAEARILGAVPRSVFLPVPAVESSLVSIRRRPGRVVGPDARRDVMFGLIRSGFATRRKMLRRAIPEVRPERWLAAGVDPTARAEELDVADWERLARVADPPRGD
ncbi:MAG: 16S rRNA (adenine(1518)-N(6)/adenine(1519)-N(6))-dimethyltransferase RsmA [Acidimicrobiales bacterium]